MSEERKISEVAPGESAKQDHEISAEDLDKVSGGLKFVPPSTSTLTSGDPDEGGQ